MSKYKVIGSVASEVIKLVVGEPLAFTFESEIDHKVVVKQKKINGQMQDVNEDQFSALVRNVDTDKTARLLLAAVPASVFKEQAEKHKSLKGRSYVITKGEKPAGKQYCAYSIEEIELTE